MLFGNASKIIENWFLTLQPDNNLQFTKVGTRNSMELIWALDTLWYICLCTNLCTYLFMHFCERKESFIKILSLILYMKFRFLAMWYFDVKGTGWVGLELTIIFTETVGRFSMWVTPYTGILTLIKLKYFISKDLSTKTL